MVGAPSLLSHSNAFSNDVLAYLLYGSTCDEYNNLIIIAKTYPICSIKLVGWGTFILTVTAFLQTWHHLISSEQTSVNLHLPTWFIGTGKHG